MGPFGPTREVNWNDAALLVQQKMKHMICFINNNLITNYITITKIIKKKNEKTVAAPVEPAHREMSWFPDGSIRPCFNLADSKLQLHFIANICTYICFPLEKILTAPMIRRVASLENTNANLKIIARGFWTVWLCRKLVFPICFQQLSNNLNRI